jgi:hypothetical protein
MSVLTTILFGLGFAGIVGATAVRDHRVVRRSRQSLLDQCANVLDGAELRYSPDGFPSLVGFHGGQRVHVELIPDTMVVRRLPQLWLSVTLLDTLVNVPSLGVLVRPAGYEFYSLTGRLTYALDPPAAFPREVLVRGSDARTEPLLGRLSGQLAANLADPRVKEIAITSKGLRIISQAAEGRRGEHLILRQAVFDGPSVSACELAKRLEELHALRSEIAAPHERLAA